MKFPQGVGRILTFPVRHWFLSGATTVAAGVTFLVKTSVDDTSPIKDLRIDRANYLPEDAEPQALTENRLSFSLGKDSYSLVRTDGKCLVRDAEGKEQVKFDCTSIQRIVKVKSRNKDQDDRLWIGLGDRDVVQIGRQKVSTVGSRFKCIMKTEGEPIQGRFGYIFRGRVPSSLPHNSYFLDQCRYNRGIMRELYLERLKKDDNPGDLLEVVAWFAQSGLQKEVGEAIQKLKGMALDDEQLLDLLGTFLGSNLLKDQARAIIAERVLNGPASASLLLRVGALCRNFGEDAITRQILHQIEVVRVDLQYQDHAREIEEPLIWAAGMHNQLGEKDRARVLYFEVGIRATCTNCQFLALERLFQMEVREDAHRLIGVWSERPERYHEVLSRVYDQHSSYNRLLLSEAFRHQIVSVLIQMPEYRFRFAGQIVGMGGDLGRRIIRDWLRAPSEHGRELVLAAPRLMATDLPLARQVIFALMRLGPEAVDQKQLADWLFSIGELGPARQRYVSYYRRQVRDPELRWDEKSEALETLEKMVSREEARVLWRPYLRDEDEEIQEEARGALIRLGALSW
ncbi:MAG: hypothetical protein HY542_04110 [Deltaproteobacteria bacterium]|nr:hypothetical protein [Deltaproteobacteria bacterium]